MVLGAGAAPAFLMKSSMKPSLLCQRRRSDGSVTRAQTAGSRGRKVPFDHREGGDALNHIPRRPACPRPRLIEIAKPALRFAYVLDRLGVLDEALRIRIDPHGPHASVGIERIGVRAGTSWRYRS